jgi:sodium/bile acid cotransporter 7
MDHLALNTRLIPKMPRLFCALILLWCFAGVAGADQELSDAEKKETVYRMYAGYKRDFPEVKDISPRQAMALLARDRVVFVDTREPAEMAVSMLPGAVSEKDFFNQLSDYKDKTIVSYCTISYRSGKFASRVAKQGITVINLQGGILAWTLEGGKVYDQDGNGVKRIHVYGDTWDYAPEGYESVKFSLWRQIF